MNQKFLSILILWLSGASILQAQNSYTKTFDNPTSYNNSSVGQLAIWTFDNMDAVRNGTKLMPTSNDVLGTPYLQQLFQEIDDNGKDGIAYADTKGKTHESGRAIAWDDIKGKGNDAELWITISTRNWSGLFIRFDYKIDNDARGEEVPFNIEFSTDGGFNWIDTFNDLVLIDDNEYANASINLSAFEALDDQPCVILRFSGFDDYSNNRFQFDNIEIIGTKTATSPDAPTILVNTISTTNFLDLNEAGCGFIGAKLNDPTDPAALRGIHFLLSDANTTGNHLKVSASSSNQAVVPDGNLMVSGSGNDRNLTILPIGIGYTDIKVEVTDGTFTDYYLIKYAASAQLSNTSYYHSGASDASTAVAIDDNYMLVGNDEDQVIRLYDRNNSGLPIRTFDFTKDLRLSAQPREGDIEASVQVGNRIYWLSSHSNNSQGKERPNRFRMFATDISGSGLSTTLSFVDYYEYLKDDLVNWDENNGHGFGVSFFGLSASTAKGVSPEGKGGFNIEGLAMAPGSSTTAYVAFRSPQTSVKKRTKALIVPIINFPDLLGAEEGNAIFGTPIQLDLGGRGIRSLSCNEDGEYIILAGPAGSAGPAPNDFQLYYWDGNMDKAPMMIETIPGLGSGINFESIVDLPSPLYDGDKIQLIADNGDNKWYGDGVQSKNLPNNYQKSCSGYFSLNLNTIDAITPTGLCDSCPLQLDTEGNTTNTFPSELNESYSLLLYPNPAKTYFTLQLDEALDTDAEVLLMDEYGKRIAHRLMQSGVQVLEWNIDQLPAGNYVLKLTNKSGSISVARRLVVVK